MRYAEIGFNLEIDLTRGNIERVANDLELPKTGSVSLGGDVSIRVTDRAGNLKNTQTAKIAGDVGEGRFRGRKASCVGQITMVRLE